MIALLCWKRIETLISPSLSSRGRNYFSQPTCNELLQTLTHEFILYHAWNSTKVNRNSNSVNWERNVISEKILCLLNKSLLTWNVLYGNDNRRDEFDNQNKAKWPKSELYILFLRNVNPELERLHLRCLFDYSTSRHRHFSCLTVLHD